VSGIGKRVKEVRLERGMSLEVLAQRAGIKAYQTIQDLERGKSQGSKHIVALARELGVTPGWLETGHGQKELPDNQSSDSAQGMGNLPVSSDEPLTLPAINIQQFPRDVPILGSGSCGEDGLFEFNGQTLDHARRPPRLQNVKDAYAIYVSGMSMSPWREPGQLVYVHPHQQPKVGDYVVVQLHPEKGQTSGAYIKKLVRSPGKDLRLLQYEPREEITIPMRKVKSIHRVIDWDELLGL
jgi:phage repressor protein C with HTH and peptisase S24 domain